MPVLTSTRSKTDIKLPSSGITVSMWNELSMGDAIDAASANTEMKDGKLSQANSASIGASMVLRLIESWDATDEDGKVLKVNEENIRMLGMKDGNVLLEKLGSITGKSSVETEVKKN